MTASPEKEIVVRCGHTHGFGIARPLPNLHVITGGAVYGTPRMQAILAAARERATGR